MKVRCIFTKWEWFKENGNGWRARFINASINRLTWHGVSLLCYFCGYKSERLLGELLLWPS